MDWIGSFLVLASVALYSRKDVLLGSWAGVLAALVWLAWGYDAEAWGLVALNVALLAINGNALWRSLICLKRTRS